MNELKMRRNPARPPLWITREPAVSRTALLLGIAVVTLAPNLAQAQSANQLKPVTVESEADAVSPGDVLIGPDAIDRRNPATIKDVFRNQPGVSVGGGTQADNKV